MERKPTTKEDIAKAKYTGNTKALQEMQRRSVERRNEKIAMELEKEAKIDALKKGLGPLQLELNEIELKLRDNNDGVSISPDGDVLPPSNPLTPDEIEYLEKMAQETKNLIMSLENSIKSLDLKE